MTPKFRQTLYALGTVATSILGLLSVWNVVSPDKSAALNAAMAATLSLFGVGAAGTAAVVTGKQRREGAFDQTNPADAVINGVQSVIEARANAERDAERVAGALTGLVKDVPVLGPLAREALDRLR